MLLIKGKDFEMEQVKASPFFDLSMDTLVNEGKDNERTELKLCGYGMSFEHCVKTIIAHRLSLLNTNVTLVEYLAFYKKMVDGFVSSAKIELVDRKKSVVIEDEDIEE